MTLRVSYGAGFGVAQTIVEELVEARIAARISAFENTLWGEDAAAEAAIRLGWLNAPERAAAVVYEAQALREELAAAGINRFVLCGMGGSSLGPELLDVALDKAHPGAQLLLCDSTHPDQLAPLFNADPQNTAVIVASKSGSTVETLSHMRSFERVFADQGINAGERLIFITDPGSELAKYGEQQNSRVFYADPEVGGRYSVLTAFGLVPAVLAGADTDELIADATAALAAVTVDSLENPALQLAALLAANLPQRYLIALRAGSATEIAFADWVEQLLAESTGKDGKGVLPYTTHSGEFSERPFGNTVEVAFALNAAGEQPLAGIPAGDCAQPATRVPDEQLGNHQLTVSGSLGEQLVLWEFATAVLGYRLALNPFDQPDVESTKIAARRILAGEIAMPDQAADFTQAAVDEFAASLPENGYLCVQVYSDRSPAAVAAVEAYRSGLEARFRIPVIAGFGPRFLHSTGQFHKGGQPLGAFLQVLIAPANTVTIGSGPDTFNDLIAAQAGGDMAALKRRGLAVLSLNAAAINTLTAGLAQPLKK